MYFSSRNHPYKDFSYHLSFKIIMFFLLLLIYWTKGDSFLILIEILFFFLFFDVSWNVCWIRFTFLYENFENEVIFFSYLNFLCEIHFRWGSICSEFFIDFQSPKRLQAFFHLHCVHQASRFSIPYTFRHFLFSPRVRRLALLAATVAAAGGGGGAWLTTRWILLWCCCGGGGNWGGELCERLSSPFICICIDGTE